MVFHLFFLLAKTLQIETQRCSVLAYSCFSSPMSLQIEARKSVFFFEFAVFSGILYYPLLGFSTVVLCGKAPPFKKIKKNYYLEKRIGNKNKGLQNFFNSVNPCFLTCAYCGFTTGRSIASWRLLHIPHLYCPIPPGLLIRRVRLPPSAH